MQFFMRRDIMKNLLVYLKNYKKECVIAPLFKMLEAIFELFVPLVMAKVIDVGIAEGNISYIMKMCGILILLGIVGLICSVTAQYFAAKAAVGFATEVRFHLFEHIQSLSFSKQDHIGASTLITRMTSDINQSQSAVNMFLRLFLRSPFVVIGAMVMAFTVDVPSAWIFVVIIPVLSVVVFGIMGITLPMYRNIQGRLDAVTRTTRENLSGVRVIRAFCMEEKEVEVFHGRNEQLTRLLEKVGRISGLMNPVTYILINAATLALIYYGALRVDGGAITQGMVVALVNYMGQILIELIKFANLIVTITKGIACGNRIWNIFEIPTEDEAKEIAATETLPVAKEEEISFSHVGICYEGSKEEALSDITFQVRKGEIFGIIGGTGSGKSTLVHLIEGFYPHTAGEIRIAGRNILTYDKMELRKKIGLVPQKAVLFQGTLRENLLWGNEGASDEELYEALRVAQALDIVEKKDGLNTDVAANGKNFSGGQRQRLTIARALVRRPEILILDDSASALDYATDAALRGAIRQLSYQPTVVIVSQRASSVRFANQILVLEDGKMEALGTHEELIECCELYQEIYRTQFEGRKKGESDE